MKIEQLLKLRHLAVSGTNIFPLRYPSNNLPRNNFDFQDNGCTYRVIYNILDDFKIIHICKNGCSRVINNE